MQNIDSERKVYLDKFKDMNVNRNIIMIKKIDW